MYWKIWLQVPEVFVHFRGKNTTMHRCKCNAKIPYESVTYRVDFGRKEKLFYFMRVWDLRDVCSKK